MNLDIKTSFSWNILGLRIALIKATFWFMSAIWFQPCPLLRTAKASLHNNLGPVYVRERDRSNLEQLRTEKQWLHYLDEMEHKHDEVHKEIAPNQRPHNLHHEGHEENTTRSVLTVPDCSGNRQEPYSLKKPSLALSGCRFPSLNPQKRWKRSPILREIDVLEKETSSLLLCWNTGSVILCAGYLDSDFICLRPGKWLNT